MEYCYGVETNSRGKRKKEGIRVAAGLFRPRLPGDTFEVCQLFAIAARTVCVAPASLDEVNARLEIAVGRLVAPEARAATECLKLWKLFARVAQVPKASLRSEAARAFCRDLDALGQRLDLPPLADWDDLPEGLDDPMAFSIEASQVMDGLLPLSEVRARARALYAHAAKGNSAASAGQTAQLLGSMQSGERRQLFEGAVGGGLLGRGDVNLLIRFLIKGTPVGPADTTLIDVLERLGRHLASSTQ